MKAMMLSAGEGVRMLPLTRSLPKPAIPVLGRPLAVQILQGMARGGADEVVVNLHHLPDAMRKLLGNGSEIGLPPLHYSYEESILGTGGGLRKAAPLLRGEGPILVCNADSLSDIDFRAALESHKRSGQLATLVLAPQRPPYSVIEVDREGAVLSLAGKPIAEPERVAGRFLYTGCQILDEEVLDRIPEGHCCIVRDVYRDLAAEGRLGSYIHEGFWWEFGSPALYLEGCMRLLDLWRSGRRRVTEHDPVRQLDEAIAAIGTGAHQHERARFKGRAALGFASHVSHGSCLEDTIVMPEAWIGPDCRLRRAVVAQGVEIPTGFEAREALVCTDEDPTSVLPPTVRRIDGLLLCSFEFRPA